MTKIIIAGGGTGGHVYPGLAVAEEVRRRHPDWEVAFVGTLRGLETRVLPETGFPLHLISVRALPRRPGLSQLVAGFCFLQGLMQSLRLLRSERPAVVLGTGGFVSAPVALAARLLRIPVVIQEQNSVPGLTNRWLSGMVNEVHINFSESRQYFRRKNHLKLTGNPVRREVLSGDPRATAEKYGLDPARFTLFVFGGSRGAHSLNQAVVNGWPLLSHQPELQLIMQTGSEDYEWVSRHVSGPGVVVRDYLPHISEAYCVADLVVARAGAMTISEITACGLPSILVPYPHAAQKHQLTNAQNLVSRGAAAMLADEDMMGERLAREVLALMEDRARLKTMARNARSFGRVDAAEKIVRSLERYALGGTLAAEGAG
ncbi:MAG TPA: undecaprenyldiphospho-muramoylpentapeptide beta-N-acetylglucosaminyltransferase [Candidatus Saccharimonadales bacterium]|nr:undecaprenyldiphospho-muramoylpentapeptide beta-N-acetylglucosaminyltransferase [Candidatus Saccharimonadales bacterium]